MKTGRVRSKESAPVAEPTPAAPPPTETPTAPAPEAVTPPAAPARAPTGNLVQWVSVAVVAAIALIVLVMLLRGCRGPDEWVPAVRATGNWTTGIQVFGPQMQVQQTWQADCQSARGLVRSETCVLQDTGRFGDQPVDQREEYAYNIYWDETYGKVYEAQGTEFVVTQLGSDDRVEGNRRYVAQESLKNDTCQQTEYTIWVDDPQDTTQEVEVYLYDCEVWDLVSVYEQVQAPWCQCEVTTVVLLGTQDGQGTGLDVSWPVASVPSGGRSEQSFEGRVTFVGEDYTLAVTTQDPNQYRDWLTGQYYLGIKDGRAVQVTKNPPQ